MLLSFPIMYGVILNAILRILNYKYIAYFESKYQLIQIKL